MSHYDSLWRVLRVRADAGLGEFLRHLAIVLAWHGGCFPGDLRSMVSLRRLPVVAMATCLPLAIRAMPTSERAANGG
jgi:hypothetical protein